MKGTLRLPEDLHDWLARRAMLEGRSVNNLIVHLLSMARREDTKDVEKKPTG